MIWDALAMEGRVAGMELTFFVIGFLLTIWTPEYRRIGSALSGAVAWTINANFMWLILWLWGLA